MVKDPKKLEQALAKQARRDARKQKDQARKDRIQDVADSTRINLSSAGSWELLGCWVNADWAVPTSINQVVVARKNSAGVIAMGLFLVDLACLGVKNAMSRAFASEYEFKSDFLPLLSTTQEMQPCSLDFAAKMISTAVAYARGLGFEPQKDLPKAMRILGEVHPENCADEIPTGGEDGRPFFYGGPYDNNTRIINTLNRTVGEGNYQAVIGTAVNDFFEDDEWEEEEEDTDDKIIDVEAHKT